MAPTPYSEYASRRSEANTLNAATEDKNDDENTATSADRDRSYRSDDMMAWFGWMLLFGIVGIFFTVGVQHFVTEWCEGDLVRQSREWMMDQADQLRRGEINCLVNPDPAFVDELLADTTCAANVRDLYLGGDLSDPRLGRLRELPNLKCIIFLFAENQNSLLKRLHGMPSVEELTFDRTWLSRDDMLQIAAFPHLKSLSFDQRAYAGPGVAEIAGHPSIERLAIQSVKSNKELIAILKTMPHLRDVSLGVGDENFDTSHTSFESALKRALPRCKCRVWDDSR
jgi:hypothetical protein